MAALPRPRLHANLLFYGLDGGLWSDPPAGGSTWEKTPWEVTDESQDAVWSNTGGSNGAAAGPTEQSTDEGSDEPKGSESDSLPDSNEGYLVSNHHIPNNAPPMLPYMSTTASMYASGHGTMVPPHAATSPEASSVYSPYMPPGSFMSTHGFGNAEAGTFSYEPVASHYPLASSLAAPHAQLAAPLVGAGEHGSLGVVPATAVGPDGVPSIGSYHHLSGQCSRCCFHPKGRCANGYSCQFCHYDHDKRPRNGKKKRYRRQGDGSVEGIE